jgi:hypothetical protein
MVGKDTAGTKTALPVCQGMVPRTEQQITQYTSEYIRMRGNMGGATPPPPVGRPVIDVMYIMYTFAH